MRRLAGILFALALIITADAVAQDVPRRMTYQGRLTRTDGTAETAAQDLKFALYGQLTGGTPLWEETHAAVSLTNGYYAVLLGKTVALPASLVTGQELYLGISIGGGAELAPRSVVASVPYALKASDALRLDGKAVTEFALVSHSHSNATTSQPGFMSAADKARFDAIPFALAGTGLQTQGSGSGSSLDVDFTEVARAVHSHPITCTYRTASGVESAGVTSWCAPGESLTGGGCEGALSLVSKPVGVNAEVSADAGLGTGGHLCKGSGASTVTSWAYCCL